jgi:hypothetical protein
MYNHQPILYTTLESTAAIAKKRQPQLTPMSIGWAYLIHQTLFVGFIRMEKQVVGGQWLRPVDGLPRGFLFGVQPILSIFWNMLPQ